MKIRSVAANHRRKAFEVRLSSRTLALPFAKVDPPPSPGDKVVRVYADADLGREGFTYVLSSGKEGTVHVDQVLDYNADPAYLRNLLVYKLTLEAQQRVDESPLSRRELIRRMGTSATQFYRLLDPANPSKTVDQLLRLFQALDCEVDFVIRRKSA